MNYSKYYCKKKKKKKIETGPQSKLHAFSHKLILIKVTSNFQTIPFLCLTELVQT